MNKHYFKGLFFSLLVCAAPAVQAGLVSADDAKQLAAEFFSACKEERYATPDALELIHTQEAANKPLYYVFNARDGKAYIIMSADDCATPILAYSLESEYNAGSLPPAMQWMMKGFESEIEAAPDIQQPLARDARRNIVRRNANDNQRIYLPTAAWSQEAPFNSMIPGRPLTGCVGTAMSIIMKYHNFPERGTGSYNGVNFDVAYDWTNMRTDNYRQGFSQAEAEAVGMLVYHAAASIGTQFGYSGSSAYEVKVPAALINYFGYDPGVSFKKRSETRTQAEFDLIVENEIRAGRPVLYCGQDMTMGHAFVVDGFDPLSRMIHVNWGWSGQDGNNNGGWYASTALNPTVSQAHNFSYLTTVIYNIKPGSGDNSIWSPLHITADGGQTGMGSDLTGDLTQGKEFTVRVGNLKNLSYEKFSGKITVALFGSDGTFKTALSKIDNFSLEGMAIFSRAYADFRCTLPAGTDIAEGDMIRMATSSDGGNTWKAIAGELITTNEIPAKGASPKYFAISNNTPSGATFTGEPRVIQGWNYTFKVVPAKPESDVVTVKSNGYVLSPDANYNYTISNVLADQEIAVYVQNAADVKEKRSIWVGEPGTLETILSGPDAATVKELTLFGTIDARDFTFMRSSMKLTSLDMSGVRVVAYQANPANAIPREAFRGLGNLKEIILPNSINRFNNGAFRSSGITRIIIPAAVSTYENNVFNGCYNLREIWVKNSKPAFVNWCVFHGCPKDRKVYCPNLNSQAAYKNDKYWNQPGIDDNVEFLSGENKYPESSDLAFAVMEDNNVKFTTDTEPGRYTAGTKVTFTAEYIPLDDNRMEVYANSTRLIPDAQGKYTTTVNGNTIIHFDIIRPIDAEEGSYAWTITDDGGTVGMFTDVVNVIPGVPFSIRINSFNVTNLAFWATVLTTADGKIKEFISPISTWTSATGAGQRMTVNCCVNESAVREGNLIRMATSHNKRDWCLVTGSNDNVVAALPAVNNQTPVYNFTFNEGWEEKANTSGIVSSAVRGRDLTFRITPKSAYDYIDVTLNGKELVKQGKTFSYSFIAKENLDFEINIYPPVSYSEATIVLQKGEHLYYLNSDGVSNWYAINQENAVKYRETKKLKIVGELDYYDFEFFRNNGEITAQLKTLDLSEATIVIDRDKTADSALPNIFPRDAFYSTYFKNSVGLEEIILPPTVESFSEDCFRNCSKLKEITIPSNIRDWGDWPNYNEYAHSWSTRTGSGFGDDVFAGCTALETIYMLCGPGKNGNVGHWNYSQYRPLKTGLPDNKKVTVVVPSEYLDLYKTPMLGTGYDGTWSNGWEAAGFNIVSEYPVYTLDFNASRCFVADNSLDLSNAASFLKDNIALEQIERKVCIAALSNESANRPEGVDAFKAGVKTRIYDNGALVAPEALDSEGALTVTFYNPNKHADKSGNHNIEVMYLYDVAFNCSSASLKVVPEIHNNEAEAGDKATAFEVLRNADTDRPVLESVRENSTVRFKVEAGDINTSEISSVVKSGENVISPDAEGYYSIEVGEADVAVVIYAVPHDGATLTAADIDAINASEATEVSSIALSGDIDSQKVKEIVSQFPALEQLDLSALTSPLPAEALAGNETLTTVVLPSAEYIEAGTFKNCTNLSAVEVPECVNVIAEEAFAGCQSLETLSLTGIQSIGANAFSGCTGMTSILFETQHGTAPAKVRRRVESAITAGYSADAFAGLNPNCLVYIDEGENIPAGAGANYIRVLTNDENGDKVRHYEAAGSIKLDSAYPFDAVNTFTLPEGTDISLDMSLQPSDGKSNWSSLLLPFSPTMVLDENAHAVLQYSDTKIKPETDKEYFVVATLQPDDKGNDFSLATGIKANTPYLAAMHTDSRAATVSFVAKNAVVEQTPDNIRMNGEGFDLTGSFGRRTLDATTTYKLNESGSSFVAETNTESVDEAIASTAVAPFSVYIEAPAGSDRTFDIDIDIAYDASSGIEGIGSENGTLRVVRNGNSLTIYSPAECSIEVYAVDGRLVEILHLSEGANKVDSLARGLYIINGVKIAL